MPSTMTHNYFALDVYERLNEKIKDKLKDNIEDLKTFAQGPDLFFFYKKMVGSDPQKIREFGGFVHRNKTKEFFIELITYIKENNLENNKQVLAFLYGFVCHYVLDSVAHPFIFYKTGLFNKKEKSTFKYNGLHYEMEYYIDIYMIYQNEKVSPRKFKIHKSIANTKISDQKLSETIDYIFNKVFDKKNMSKTLQKCIKDTKSFSHLMNYDSTGLKKKTYQFLDFVKPRKMRKLTPLSFNIPPKMKIHYLNLEKNEWNHPSDETETSNLSFVELYIIALDKAVSMINEIDNILTKNKSLKLLNDIFLNTSYITGKNCDDQRPMQYFEF